MRILTAGLFFAAIALGSAAADAQTAASPNTVTATCKDSSTQTGASRRAACKGHGGVQPAKAAAAAPAAAAATPPASGTTTPPASGTAAPVEQTAPVLPATKTPHRAAAPIVARTPTNPGDVWVNSATKIYHCPSDKAYGKTKAGSFMTEAAAKAAGNRASHNKACTAAAAPAQ